MNWRLIVDDGVRTYLKRIPKRDAARLTAALEAFTVNPYTGDIERMKGENDVWRRRVGSYRIFYEVYPVKNIIYVVAIERRTSTTY